MGSSCSRQRPAQRTSSAQTSGNQLVSLNQVTSNPQQVTNGGNTDRKTDPLHSKDADGKIPTEDWQDEAQIPDEEIKKSVKVPISTDVNDVDICPICLEEYSAENPKLITQCKHDYHFACMLEWMDRSCTCPICSAETLLDDCKICCD